MAPPAPLLPLLLALLGRADPGRACDLQPVTAEPPITLSYATSTVARGCVSSGSLDTSREVHVLNIKWTKVPAVPLNVSVTPQAGGCIRPAVLIIFCSRCLATITSPCPDLLVRNDTHISLSTTTATASELLIASEGELLAWAQSNYGGITSYSELRDPRWVQLRLGEDASSPRDCIPQERFDAAPHLETEVFFHGVKGCSQEDAQNTRAAHIVRLQPEPRYSTVQEGYGICRHGMLMLEGVVSWFHSSPITEVNLSLSCPEKAVSNQIVILQSKANLTWSLYVYKCDMRFMVSGNYTIVSLPSTQIPGVPLPDTEQGLIAKAFEKNYSVIASYSIIPVSTHISLEIREHETVRSVPVIPTTSAPTDDHDTVPRILLSMLKPWKCTDETLEIVIAKSHLAPIKDVVNITLRDISCQAEKNTTHFMLKAPLSHCGTLLEGRGHARNELILSLARDAVLRSVRVGFQCNIPRELFLRLFPTAAFEAPQTELEVNKEAFVQASMQWEDHPADLQLKECWLVAPGWEPVLLVQGGEARAAGVAVLEGPPSSHGRKVWRFRFTYSVPKGQHVPFSATLKCKAGLQASNNTIFEKVLEVTVKDGWQSLNNRGLGLAAVLGITFGAFLIGALLTAGLWYIYSHTRPISKLQPVSSTAPASESSSTNHSIGSTQSTPCSTSSMA